MQITTSFRFGQIVLIRFPFTNQHGSKQRPALVISTTTYNQMRPDVILMAVTSQIRSEVGFGEAVIVDWEMAGLLKPSVIKPIIFTAENSMIKKTLGQLEQSDQKRLKGLIETIIG